MPRPAVLVLGVGQTHCGDDAAGVEAARRLGDLAGTEVEVCTASGESSALIEAFDGRERVFLVDAARSGARPGSLRRFDAVAAPLPAGLARRSTHAWGVAEAVELARALGRLPRELVVYTVEGRTFHPGGDLSPEVDDALDELVKRLREELQAR